jgi:protocatechuate 3,4-dioxygenase beta subunit
MQRPLLVLLIVLAAIVALVFAVLNLGGGDKSDTTAIKPVPVEGSTNGGPAVPPDLAPTDKNRSTQPTKPDPTRASLSGAGNIQFDNRLTGLVKNTLGQPVAEAEVTLSTMWTEVIQFQNDIHDRTNEPRARTDAEGRYSFPGVEPRHRYSLIVTHPEYAMKVEQTTPVGETGALEQPPIILSPGASLSGYVNDDAGNLIPDATLHLDGEDYAGMTEVPPDRITTTTDKSGYYSFTNVAPGRRTVSISAAGYGSFRSSSGQLVFEKQERLERNFTLKVAQMICGRVIGPGSDGVPDALVLAIGVSSTQQTPRSQVKTNAQGEFCFEDLAPGEYNVIASAKGWRMRPQQNRTRIGTNSSNVVIEMQKEGMVCGTVIDGATGAPVADFQVRLRIFSGEGSPTSPVSEELTAVTNPAGEYCIDGVGPTSYVVEARAQGFAPSFSPSFTMTQSQRIDGIVVKLGRGGTITGRVVDAEGKPIARARVVTHENDWVDDELTAAFGFDYPNDATMVDVRTDDSGRFTCGGLTPETYQVVVTANNFTAATRRDLRVTESGTVQAGDIKLSKGGTVKGILFDSAGKPVVGGTINLRVTDGDVPGNYSTRTTDGGKFVFSNVMPGRYQLSGMRAGGGEANPFEDLNDANGSQVKIIVAENDVTTQNLTLK